MTTNHKENLDPALLRPGRADKHVFLDYASKLQAEQLFLRFNPEKPELAKKFAEKLPDKRVSMARLQGFFLENMKTPEKTIESIDSLFEEDEAIADMDLDTYLTRLGLDKYKDRMKSCRTVEDLNKFNLD